MKASCNICCLEVDIHAAEKYSFNVKNTAFTTPGHQSIRYYHHWARVFLFMLSVFYTCVSDNISHAVNYASVFHLCSTRQFHMKDVKWDI